MKKLEEPYQREFDARYETMDDQAINAGLQG